MKSLVSSQSSRPRSLVQREDCPLLEGGDLLSVCTLVLMATRSPHFQDADPVLFGMRQFLASSPPLYASLTTDEV